MKRVSCGPKLTLYLAHSFQQFALSCPAKRVRSFDSGKANSAITNHSWLAPRSEISLWRGKQVDAVEVQ